MKLGRDEILMAPHMYRLFGQIRPGMDQGQDNNRSVMDLFSKGLQTRRLQQQNERIAVI